MFLQLLQREGSLTVPRLPLATNDEFLCRPIRHAEVFEAVKAIEMIASGENWILRFRPANGAIPVSISDSCGLVIILS